MTDTRPAAPDDLSGVAALISRLNAHPASQSLHCAAQTPTAIRRALWNKEDFPFGWERSFVVATESATGGIVATLGAQFDPDRTVGWLWGPWVETPKLWPTVGKALLDRLLDCAPKSLRRLEAFLHVENAAGLRFLQAHGFSPGLATHIYTVPRARWTATGDAPSYPALRPAHEVAFAHLHADTFPTGGSTPAQILLDGRDGEHAIFAASDGLRLLGSVCVSVNHAPAEGFIDYLAVKPAARGRGIGARLLQTALHWTFETHRLPQASLCVSNWRDGARRLYEQAGFTLQATGVAVRRRL